ncbi:MAG: hypothetical protein LBS81_03380 [Endomicrobium sp.]|jgi:uncharacterized protein (UPF0333 family)|nr:hypothetical protein [Endomicrobium sp.]
MRKNKGQTLMEFVFIFVVLLVATTGVLIMYKTFWETKYQKVSAPSSALVGIIAKVNYVK